MLIHSDGLGLLGGLAPPGPAVGLPVLTVAVEVSEAGPEVPADVRLYAVKNQPERQRARANYSK